MISGSAFQEIGAVIDELEEREMTVLDVVTERGSLADSQRLSVEITVELNCLSELSAAGAVSIVPSEPDAPDGGVTTTFTVEIPVGTEPSATATPDDAAATEERATTETDAAEAPDAAPGEEVDAVDDVPYYKNYDLLARVYEEHNTFAEMTEALGVDVTPATVREHMVNHGIHPTASDDEDSRHADESDESDVEATGGDGRSVTIEADGYGLPTDVTMESLIHAVKRSRTLHEAQTALGLDRATTRDVLTDLDLLDFVTSRVASDRSTELEDVVDRIHAASTA